jgi:hypothetical protein
MSVTNVRDGATRSSSRKDDNAFPAVEDVASLQVAAGQLSAPIYPEGAAFWPQDR